MTKQSGKILRWVVPPGVSIVVHAGLIALILFASSQIVQIEKPRERTPLSTLAVPATPATVTPDPVPQSEDIDTSEPFKNDRIRPESLARAIAALGASPSRAPTMDPVSLEALSQSMRSTTAPTSTAPPSVRFAGVQTHAAKRIVYVVDGSGATAASFSSLQTQLLRSIDELSTTQKFQVVLFRNTGDSMVTLAPLNKDELAYATRSNKQAVGIWLDTITARGRSNPVDGLRSALALNPDLVLLITRTIQRTGDAAAWGGGRQEFLEELDALNPRSARTGQRRTVIKALQLLDEDPTGIMQAIGALHGDGLHDYRVVSYEDLTRRESLDDQPARKMLGATDEQRLQAAGEQLASITTPGILHSILYGLPTSEQSGAALDAALQIDRLVAPIAGTDALAALLAANAGLINNSIGEDPVDLRLVLETLDDAMFASSNADANRRLIVAALHHALGDHDRAIRSINTLLEEADELQLDDLTRASALLALCSMGAAPADLDELSARAPFETPARELDPLWAILLAESKTRGLLGSGASAPWVDLIRIRELAGSDPSLVQYIDAKIESGVSRFAQQGASLDTSPSEVILAAANGMSTDPEKRIRAIALLQIVADREDAALAPEALWRLGVIARAHNTARTREMAAEALATLATKYPEHPLAGDALTGAIANAPQHQHTRRRALLRQALDRYPDRIEADLWRLELARLLEEFARLDVLDTIPAGTREGVIGGELYEQTILAMLTKFDDPSVRRALLSRMSATASRLRLPSAPAWAQRAAASELRVNPDAAADRLVGLIEEAASHGEDTGELELLRARALIDAGKKSEAFGLLTSIAARHDATIRRNDTYWQAWALMLETIANDGTETDKLNARAHIKRLLLVDPQLGGSPWKERITRASDELHSQP